MTIDRSKAVLQAGMDSALEKMSSDRCLPKKEITNLSFLELYARILMEQRELEDEIRKTRTDYSDAIIPIKVLEAIRFEAGDIIAFAAGLVAKVDAEIGALTNKEINLSGLNQ
jgi:hypothetical protein